MKPVHKVAHAADVTKKNQQIDEPSEDTLTDTCG